MKTHRLSTALARLAAGVFFLAAAAGAHPVELYMNESLLTAPGVLTVGDLLRISTGIPEGLAEQPLGVELRLPSLIPRRSVRDALSKYRRQSLQEVGGGIVLIGGRSAVVPSGRYGEEEAVFLIELLLFLDREDYRKDGRLELEILDPLVLPRRTGGELPTFSLRKAGRRIEYLSGEAEVSFRFLDSGGSLRIRIHQHVPVAVLTESVERYQAFSPSVLDYQERDISLSASDYVPSSGLENGTEFVASRDLRSGTVLESQYLEKARGVTAGDELRIRFVRGSVRMEAPGRALRSAAVGETVTVRLDEAQKNFMATVVGFGEVLIELP